MKRRKANYRPRKFLFFLFFPHETTSAEKKNIDRQGVPANVTKH